MANAAQLAQDDRRDQTVADIAAILSKTTVSVGGEQIEGTLEEFTVEAVEAVRPVRLSEKPRLAHALLNTPWLIHPSWLEALYSIADGAVVNLGALPGAGRSEAWRRGDVLALERQPGSRLAGTRLTTTRDGIATLHLTGPIIRHADMFSEMSGATSLETIARDFNYAVSHPDVKAILLNIDSPGGEAAGIDEFAAMVAAARSTKPIHAYVGDLMASAAFWIGTGASRITMARTASVGSVGTVAIVPRRDQEGYIEIVSSQSPKKRLDPESDEGRSTIQAHVDHMTSIFIEAVAEYRGVAIERVEQDFGQGGILMGKDAVAAGMADEIGSYESAWRALSREVERKRPMANDQIEQIAPTPSIEASVFNVEDDPRFKAAMEQIAKLQEENAKVSAAQLRTRLTSLIRDEGWVGADADNLLIAEHIIGSAGEESPVFAAFKRSMKATAAIAQTAQIDQPTGIEGTETESGVVAELQQRVSALQAAKPGVSAAQAATEVFAADRAFEAKYAAYAEKVNGK